MADYNNFKTRNTVTEDTPLFILPSSDAKIKFLNNHPTISLPKKLGSLKTQT